MDWQWVCLWTDACMYILLASVILTGVWISRRADRRRPWKKVAQNPWGMAALVILLAYVGIALLDSVHFRRALPNDQANSTVQYNTQIHSLLDSSLSPLDTRDEQSYSAPFALYAYSKEVILNNGIKKRDYPKLLYAGSHLKTAQDRARDIILLSLKGAVIAGLIWIICLLLLARLTQRHAHLNYVEKLLKLIRAETPTAWRAALVSLAVILLLASLAATLSQHYAILGTNKVGQDIFYITLKSIRTGLLIGTLSTLFMLPFALLLGPAAGYFSGWVDDVIQYCYTTLSAVPGVLLIAASILSLHVFISNHPDWFTTLAKRADARLLALCVILGITSWTSLCRLLRAETLKLREMDFVRAARALGTSHRHILSHHIFPNLMHIVLITVTLDFSALVLAEAALSYIGVGIDPSMLSWGNMINSARLELAREPIVWWPLAAAFMFMFALVLSANIFADSLRDAFDPRQSA